MTPNNKKHNLVDYRHLKLHEALLYGLLTYQDNGAVSIKACPPDQFVLYTGKQKLNWMCAGYVGGDALFPYNEPRVMKWGEDWGDDANAWMIFLRKLFPLTGKTYSRGKVIDVGIILAAGGLDRADDFYRLAIDDRSKSVYLGVTYREELLKYTSAAGSEHRAWY